MISRSAAATFFAMPELKENAHNLFNIFREHNQRLRQRSSKSSSIKALLQLVADNSVAEAKLMIDHNARLLLEADDVVTANAWHIECVTPLELALCCGSPEMIEMMESYFGLFVGGIEELRAIYAKYQQQIINILSVSEDTNFISPLVQVINNSSNEQLIAVFNNDMSEDNSLTNALNAHMQHAKNARRVDAKLFFPYQLLLQAFDAYDANFTHDRDFERRCIFSMRVIGPLIYQLPMTDQYRFEEIFLSKHKQRVNEQRFYYLKRVDSLGELTSPAKISFMNYVTNKQTKLLAITSPEKLIEFQSRQAQASEKKILPADLRRRWGRLR